MRRSYTTVDGRVLCLKDVNWQDMAITWESGIISTFHLHSPTQYLVRMASAPCPVGVRRRLVCWMKFMAEVQCCLIRFRVFTSKLFCEPQRRPKDRGTCTLVSKTCTLVSKILMTAVSHQRVYTRTPKF